MLPLPAQSPRKPSPLVVISLASLYLSSISPAGPDSVGKLSSSLQACMGQCPSPRPASNEPYKEIMNRKEREKWRISSSRHWGFYQFFCLVLFGWHVWFFFYSCDQDLQRLLFSGRCFATFCLLHLFPCCPLEDLTSIKIQES